MRISIVIPCYNVEEYVQRAVESALAQTYRDSEIICVDDGSSDGTLQVLKELREHHPDRITVIEQENRGACAARNAGLERSTAEYVQFLDADDVILPRKLEHQAALAIENGMPGLIVGSSRTLSSDGKELYRTVQENGDRDPWLDLMAHKLNVTSANLWRSDAVKQAGGWNEALGSSQEYDLMFRMLKNGARIIFDREILTQIHRRQGGSISQTNVRRNWERFVELRAQIMQHVKAIDPDREMAPFHQVLFDSIRTLYPFDRKKAIDYFKTYIPKDFRPTTSASTGRGYLLLHGLLGFDRANRLRQILK